MAMLDLFELFVVQVFGGFWLAVLGLSLMIFVVLLVFGKMSMNSTISYLQLFIMAMAYGYGKPIFLIPIALWILVDFGIQLASALNKSQ